MRKTFLYRVRINKATEANALEWLRLCRTLYNAALEQRILAYRQQRRSLTTYTQSVQLPQLKKELPEYGGVNSQCLQDVVERLGKAYQAFFRRLKCGEKPGFPRFKGAHRYDSFTLKQTGWRLESRCLYIRNVGRFKLFLSRPVEGKIKTVTVRRASSGKWFVAFSCDEVPEKRLEPCDKAIGVDVGLNSFFTDSDGNKVANPRYLVESQKLLRRRQRSLSRKKKGSTNREEARTLVAKAHEKVTNQRKDFAHKTALELVRNSGVICIEDLRIKDMTNKHLNKSISDVAWGMFFNALLFKAEEAGRKVVKVNPRNTSQKCSGCGKLVKKPLSVRIHKCPSCGLVIDRDHNAALNILAAGQAAQALTVPLGTVA
jgi:putative transposase